MKLAVVHWHNFYTSSINHVQIFLDSVQSEHPFRQPETHFFKRKNSMSQTSLNYRDAGVDIDAGEQLVENIKPFAKRTMRPEVLGGLGGFGALVEISKKYQHPVLVSGTDGVGTKLKLAFEWDKHDTVGIDLVAMSVNDILVQGAEPLFFLDYFACGKLDVNRATDVIKGIASGCEQSGCALIGGETAEMPNMYPEGEYDLAGFAVGVVEKERIITGKTIQTNDIILGLASNGAHSNGYSLIRKILARDNPNLDAPFDGDKTLRETIIEPTCLYVKSILSALKQFEIKGMAHITGGGILENVPRVLPENCVAQIDANAWQLPKLFQWLQQAGNVTTQEMYRTFNCGIGMVLIVSPDIAEYAATFLREQGETVYVLGKIRRRIDNEAQTQVA